MRNVLTILLAFAAGVLLMLWLPRHPGVPAVGAHPISATAGAIAPGNSTLANSASTDTDTTNGDDWPNAGPSPEQVLYAQPRMVREALAKLTPRVAGKPNLYLVTFAGDGGEDVFRNEAEYAAQLFAGRFSATDTSFRLLGRLDRSVRNVLPVASFACEQTSTLPALTTIATL